MKKKKKKKKTVERKTFAFHALAPFSVAMVIFTCAVMLTRVHHTIHLALVVCSVNKRWVPGSNGGNPVRLGTPVSRSDTPCPCTKASPSNHTIATTP
jgi:hypothetical protein